MASPVSEAPRRSFLASEVSMNYRGVAIVFLIIGVVDLLPLRTLSIYSPSQQAVDRYRNSMLASTGVLR